MGAPGPAVAAPLKCCARCVSRKLRHLSASAALPQVLNLN